MKTLVAILFFILVSFVFQLQIQADEGFSEASTAIPPSLQTAWDATVRIKLDLWQNSKITPQGQGSGVVINYDFNKKTAIVVTNGHVASCPGGQCVYNVIFFSDKKASKTLNSVKLLKDFPTLDLAFLEVSMGDLVPSVAALRETTIDLLGSEVAAIGYPGLYLRNKKTWQNSPPQDASKSIKRFSAGEVLKRRPLNFANYPYGLHTTTTLSVPYVLTHNADTLEGNSGGPVVETQSGQVVGLNTGILNPSKNHQHCESAVLEQTLNCSYYLIPSDLIIEKYQEISQ